MQAVCVVANSEEAEILRFALQLAGLNVRLMRQIEPLIETWSEQPADFCLLAFDGTEKNAPRLLAQLRAVSLAPVVVISEIGSEQASVDFYQAGADLVLARPYSLRLLGYQVRALLARSNSIPLAGLPQLVQGELTLDPARREVQIGEGKPEHLTQLEFRLLYTLLVHAGQILPAEELVEMIWGYSGEGNRDLVRGLVQRLRSKIEPDPHTPLYIHTEPGVGYYFKIPAPGQIGSAGRDLAAKHKEAS